MTAKDLSRLPAPWKGAGISPLAGDASTRRWYRLALPPAPAGPATAILMAVPGENLGVAADTVATFRMLGSFGWPVPGLLWAKGRRAVMTDAGDVTLERAEAASPGASGDLHRRAVELLVDLQRRGTPRVHPRSRWARRAFSPAFFLEELEVSERCFFRGALTAARPPWREEMGRFLAPLAEAPKVLCHRDYHSRNIMVGTAGSLTVIDCQDARLGPPWYDLVSLLRDSYLDLPPGLEAECLARYRRGMTGTPVADIPEDPFAEGYFRCAVQRHLKVLGTFARLAMRGKPGYLAWVPRTLRLLREALVPFPELSWVADLLPPEGPG